MLAKKIVIRTTLLLLSLFMLSACGSTPPATAHSDSNVSAAQGDENLTDSENEPKMGVLEALKSSFSGSNYTEEQPEFPTEEDDPFFREEQSDEKELFRVLLNNGDYQLRQISGSEAIRRRQDESGDSYRADFFYRYSKRYDFKSWIFRGTLKIILDPESGEIQFVGFVPGKTPKTWQASKFFKEDLSRFSFNFPSGEIYANEFLVTYEWRIERRPGMSDDEARERAIEFLKTQKR